jgi:hypothetical protein
MSTNSGKNGHKFREITSTKAAMQVYSNYISQTVQPVEKRLAELKEEYMSLTAQRGTLEGEKRAKTSRDRENEQR